ncbi:curlin repeat-containing protein [Rhizobium leguminosarum]|uniref:Curlin n=2 Tax=Rhizobium leguminosarum TaxID=384 RepID=A0A154ICL1_RHILE|nr:curlin repeat-containing protein [Rhizobium leguminosarum]KZA98175.1 curlin [Rhizobium leguminosarum]
MTRNMFKILTVTLLTGSLAQVAFSAPAYAGGRISFDLAPDNAEDAGLFSTGLRVYSLYRGLKDADIRQLGRGNAAGIAQAGGGNLGFIRQRGNGHSATLRQNGNNNAYGIFQYGRNAETDVVQDGDNGSGATFSYGW